MQDKITDHGRLMRRRFRPNAIAGALAAAGDLVGSSKPGAAWAEVVDVAGRVNWRTSFATAVASGVDTDFWSIVGGTPAGMTVAQTGGNLVVTAGQGASEELIIRSALSFSGGFRAQWAQQLSGRIANQQFFVEMVDVLDDGLAFTINSATSVTITLSDKALAKLTKGAGHVGQSINIGAIGGGAPVGCVPGRYAISNVAVVGGQTQVTFTVAGWPAAGGGTCSLFGWNFFRTEYSGTTAAAAFFDAGRKGYASGNGSALTINTTAAPGHIGIMAVDDMVAAFLDQLAASSTTAQVTMRGSRVANTPDADVELYLQVRVLNGTVAPASNTTMTLGMVSVSDFVAQPVSIEAARPMGYQAPMPVQQVGNVTAAGAAADGATASGNPLPIAVEARTTNKSAATSGQTLRPVSTTVGVLVQRPYSIPELEWSYAAAAGGITNTTDVAAKAAAGASTRNYVTAGQVQNSHASVGTELVIKDGATVIHRVYLPPAMPQPVPLVFPSPLKGTANTALNVACITTGASVYCNLQGYSAP